MPYFLFELYDIIFQRILGYNMPIFKHIQQQLHKENSKETLKHPDATLIQSGNTLLATEKRQQHVIAVKALLNLPPKIFNNIYYQVIEQFAEFVQSLPETVHGAFASEGGFLDHGIERASRALSLCATYFFPEEKNLQNVSSEQALWIYAVFTAALLYDVGKLAVKYDITITRKSGAFIKKWLPYTSSMIAQGKYYQFEFVKENRDNLRRLVTPLLARQILQDATQLQDNSETNGFNWLASNSDVLEAWLTLLSGETRIPMSSFMSLIPLADAQVINSHIKNLRLGTVPAGMFIGVNPQANDSPFATTLATGDAFLEWLKAGLANGNISVNQKDSLVHTTQEGVLISSELFKEFSHENLSFKNPEGTEQQFRKFLELYQAPIGDLGKRYSAIRGISTVEMDKYLLIQNVYLLFAMGQVPPASIHIVKLSENTVKPMQEQTVKSWKNNQQPQPN